jgi:hypothetical protein
MSTPATVINAVKTAITNNANLTYVKQVMLGIRSEIPIYPCIILEPLNLLESNEVYTKQEMKLTISIYGYIKAFDNDLQIAGDSNTKGILDLENDLKKALDNDRTFSNNALDSKIINTKYEFTDYPIRYFVMEFELYFRQDLKTRA